MADYNINAATRRVVLSGSAGTGPYSFTFAVLVQTDLAVYLNSTKLTLTTDYTVSIATNGTGTVTLNTGTTNVPTTPGSSDSVIIVGARALERTTDFVTAGDLRASALNEQLDANVIFDQQLAEENQRTVKAPVFDPATTEGGGSVDMTLPAKDTRKGKYLAFNATTGNPEAGPSVSDVTTVSAAATDIALLADIQDGTTATNAITTVASNNANVATVGGISANVTTVAGISSNVTTVAGKASLITSDFVADLNTLATADIVSDLDTVSTNISAVQGASGNATTATTKASEAAASATTATTKATEAASSATAAASSATAAASSQTAAAASAASAASAFDNFDDTYLGSKTSNPTVDNDGDALVAGALYFNSTANEMRVYDGANWIAATSAGNVSLILYEYTATSGQTTFSGSDDNSASLSYTVDNLQVVMNGVVLDPADFTATNGTSVVLDSGASVGDQINIYAFKSFTTADMVSKTAGGTFSGAVGFSGGITGDVIIDDKIVHAGDTNTAIRFPAADTVTIETAGSERVRVDSNGQLGIGVTSVDTALHVKSANDTVAIIESSDATAKLQIKDSDSTNGASLSVTNETLNIQVNGGTRATIDSSGNVLVAHTGSIFNNINATSTVGTSYSANGEIFACSSQSSGVMILNRKTTDGDIASFRKDGTTAGQIGVATKGGEEGIYIGNIDTGLYFRDQSNAITPADPNSGGADRDNAIDLGFPSIRFNDAFIYNGVTTGSDQNEKQQIASLTDAEIAAAKRISNGFKTFKWNDAVAAKGDNARTHTGVIAQEVRTALEAEGLDAGDYAFFMSNTWWETQTEVPAVEADEENGIEAKDAYTRTDTYETAEEAPEGATERTRLGIRYAELLAFIGAATEQRLADIETRLTALEAE